MVAVLDQLYIRQKPLQLDVPRRALVVGLGGTGTWTAIMLAMVGVEELYLVDSDTLEAHNLNRLPFTPQDVYKPKVEAVREFIKRIRPYIKVYAFRDWFENIVDVLPRNLDVVFDCTDRISAQKNVYSFALKNNIPYISAHYDGLHISVEHNYLASQLGEEPETYRVTPSYIVPAMLSPALAVHLAVKHRNSRHLLTANIDKLIEKINIIS